MKCRVYKAVNGRQQCYCVAGVCCLTTHQHYLGYQCHKQLLRDAFKYNYEALVILGKQ